MGSSFRKTLTLSVLASSLISLVVGGYIALAYIEATSQKGGEAEGQSPNEPLYWVAPMDPNYRRDEPGKSPMGMDLVPVFANDERGTPEGTPTGTIHIDANVVSNIGVKTAPLRVQKLQRAIDAFGYVSYDEARLVHIHPRVSGWVDKLYVKASGDPVKKGAPLYSLYSPELVNAQEDLVLARSRKNQRLLNAAEDRMQALQIPQKTIDKLKAGGQISQTVTFFAPQDGVVDMLNIREGYYVQPGTTMLSIGALDQVWLEVELFAQQAEWVKKGDKVDVNIDFYPEQQWAGRVDYIYPSIGGVNRTLKCRVQLLNPDFRLKPNMYASVKITTSATGEALLAPREAVIPLADQNRIVLSLGDGQFVSKKIMTGRSSRDFIEILDGAQEGDRVVVSGQFLLDSESNKRAALERLSSDKATKHEPSHMHDAHTATQNEKVWVEAKLLSVDAREGTVTVEHAPIPSWNWPSMTMVLPLASTLELPAFENSTFADIALVKQGQKTTIEHVVEIQTSANSWALVDGKIIGEVKQQKDGTRTIRIARGPIAKWNRSAAEMSFNLAPSVSTEGLTPGTQIRFAFFVEEGVFTIFDWHAGYAVNRMKSSHPHVEKTQGQAHREMNHTPSKQSADPTIMQHEGMQHD